MQTQDVMIPVGGKQMPSFLARPDGDDPRPAVIVLQEIFGVNREVRRIAELLAGAGYVALAINYYYRTHPSLNEPYTQDGLKRGREAAGAVTKASIREDVAAAVAWLEGQPFVKTGKVATIGFCFGGSMAVVTATLSGLSGAISFYGAQTARGLASGEQILSDANEFRVPLLLFYGGKDESIPPEAIAKVDAALKAAKVSHEIVVYPDLDHAFFRESSQKLDVEEIKDAWERVQAFLKKHLG
ncbi:MAG TPA: dienelactone hydrolase family protein [Candidatus Baltobacteraceae bacterium]|nr:dienelactone hydrolase family protein [Candidatus Baltobacteraceae bacterium]